MCDCSDTQIAAKYFDSAHFYSGTLLVQTTTDFVTTVKGTPVTIDLNLDKFVDTVAVVCADYAISCGARELVVTDTLT